VKTYQLLSMSILLGLMGCSSTNKNFYNSKATTVKKSSLRTPSNTVLSCRNLIHDLLQQTYRGRRDALWSRLSSLDQVERKSLENALESIHFIDYKDTVRELGEILQGLKTLHTAEFPYAYNRGRSSNQAFNAVVNYFRRNKVAASVTWDEDAFGNFMKARKYLLDEDPSINLESFKKVHRIMMAGGIENIPADALGNFRSTGVIGNALNKGVTDIELENIIQNPYLGWRSVNSETNGDGINKNFGKILYPNIPEIEQSTLDIIKNSHPEVHASVIAYKDGNRTVDKKILQKNMVTAMMEERMAWFIKKRDQIGELSTAVKTNRYIELVVELQRSIISIHPFQNGNGRSTREFFINFSLIKEGLPPARILNPDMDLYSPQGEWTEQIMRGMEATNALYEDISRRLDLGLPIENSPELFTPYVLRNSFINSKKYSSKSITENSRMAKSDARQFMEFITYLFEKDPELLEKIKRDPSIISKSIEEQYILFFKKNKIDYKHKKDGLKELNLHFVDRDFRHMFGSQSYRHPDQWQSKMDNWYMDDVVWRGLSYRTRDVSEAEISNMFKNLHPQFVSNNVARGINSNSDQAVIKKAIFKDFDNYNQHLFSGGVLDDVENASEDGLVQMAKDHSETGPQYGISYGYSTSKNRTVGKAFAMGAMVLAPYGKQQDFQHLLKSRILVGMRRANKDVDLARLKQLRDSFSYKYGRQQEVMGIGGSDPDAVMVIQEIGADGNAIRSYVRSKINPNELWVIKGEAESTEGISDELVEKVIDLNSQ
jgi:hypothetical protein